MCGKTTNAEPNCAKTKCFACGNGRCRLLIDNNFQGRACPFYKTAKKFALDALRCRERSAVR